MAARDGAEPCCYGNIQVRELSGYVGVKRLVCLFGTVSLNFCVCVCMHVHVNLRVRVHVRMCVLLCDVPELP